MKRQGDLLIVPVNNLPFRAKGKEGRVLAEGEATGHKHELDSGMLYDDGGTLYFKIDDEDATLLHEEHGPITFEPGIYKVIQQREYEPGSWRYVGD